MEIGSEFILSNQQLSDSFLEKLYRYGRITLTSSGRSAIALILENINPINKKVLLPIYICESVITVFESYGYEIEYYDLTNNFSPKLMSYENVGIFFHMNYFGFKTSKISLSKMEEMKKSSIIIIEDVTHSMFSDYDLGYQSDYYVGSIRKWFGIPSGGFVGSKKNLELINGIQEKFVSLRKDGFKQKNDYFLKNKESLKIKYLENFSRAEELLDNDIGPYSIDEESLDIINTTSFIDISKKRRSNYSFLLKELGKTSKVKVVFKELPRGTTPLFLLLEVTQNRDLLRKYLQNKQIYCPIHWPISNSVKNYKEEFEFIGRYQKFLSIPCDQRYNITDMARVVHAISSWEGK